jgi:hypothetical protein
MIDSKGSREVVDHGESPFARFMGAILSLSGSHAPMNPCDPGEGRCAP